MNAISLRGLLPRLRRFFPRIADGSLVVAAACVGMAIAAEAPPAIDPARIEGLIRQLGSEDYEQREAAGRDILAIGLPAMPFVDRHSRSDDYEIRYRCERLKLALKDVDLDRRFEAFAKDEKGEADHDIPGWKVFRERFGTVDGAKALFIEMFRADKELMVRHAEKSPQLGRIVQSRVMEMQQSLQRGGATEGQTIGRAAALIYAQSDTAGVAASDPMMQNINQIALQLLAFGPLQQAMNKANPLREPIRAVVSRRIESVEVSEFQTAMQVAQQLDIKAILKPARKLLANKASGQPHMLPAVLSTIVRFGGQEDIPAVEPLLQDKQLLGNFQTGRGPQVQGQVGDVAMVTMLRLMKKDPKEFGFEPMQGGVGELAGFADDAKRQACREKVAAALAEWKKSKEKETGIKVEEPTTP